MIKNAIKGWKTTILGIILITSGIVYIFFNSTPDYIIMSLLIGSGSGFIFAPDKVLDLLTKKSKEL